MDEFKLHFGRSPDQTVGIQLNSDWASRCTQYRERVRQDIYKHYLIDSILDLSQPPRLPTAFVSISHSPDLGGWANSRVPVGLDIETATRVTEVIARRVMSTDEKHELSQKLFENFWAAQWVAKEASWKAFANAQAGSPTQALLISDITLKWDSQPQSAIDGVFSNSVNIQNAYRFTARFYDTPLVGATFTYEGYPDTIFGVAVL
jgi:phosphopantetheine--protein transferase-like protein